MTTSNNNENITKVLWSNSQINKVTFDQKEFTPINRGHGLYVKTTGNDTVIDLRMGHQKPFWGHTHPLLVQHNFKNLKFDLSENHYSVPKTEFARIIETFQKVHFSELFSTAFEITYHNVVVYLDEKILSYKEDEIYRRLEKLVNDNPDTFFWFIEKDITLLARENLFYLQPIMNAKQVHLCLDVHFIGSIFIHSHHLFSDDENIQLFLGMKNLIENITSTKGSDKINSDNQIIDQFLSSELPNNSIQRRGRYLLIEDKVDVEKLNLNGIVVTTSAHPTKTILAIPSSCTQDELHDTLLRIKKSL